MRLFLDSNVWVAALGTRGLCLDLTEMAIGLDDANRLTLLTCPAVDAEILRILARKFHLSVPELDTARKLLSRIQQVPDGAGSPPSAYPDPDDWPIIAAALAARADLFVTGDKALLALGEIEGLPIVDPRRAYLRLRGLE